MFKWFHSDEVVSALYKEGKIIPTDENIIEKTPIDNPPKGWTEFCSFAGISLKAPQAPSVTLEGDTIGQVTMKIWMNEVGINEALADLTKRTNDGLKKEVDAGKLVVSEYQINDMNKYLRTE